MAEPTYGFTLPNVRRVARATDRVERAYRLPPVGPGDAPPAGFGAIRHAKTTSAITARSGNTLGSGHADLYHEENGVLVADVPATNVELKNWSGTSIATAKWILVAPVDGQWNVIAADC